MTLPSPAVGDDGVPEEASEGIADRSAAADADGVADRDGVAEPGSLVGDALFDAARFEADALGVAAFVGFVGVPEPAAGVPVAAGVRTGLAALVGRRVGEEVADGVGGGLGVGVDDGAAPPGAFGAVPGLLRPLPSWNRQPMKPPAGTFSEPMPTLE